MFSVEGKQQILEVHPFEKESKLAQVESQSPREQRTLRSFTPGATVGLHRARDLSGICLSWPPSWSPVASPAASLSTVLRTTTTLIPQSEGGGEVWLGLHGKGSEHVVGGLVQL